MPSFSFLFADPRGDDLVAYLASLHTAGTSQHEADQRFWQPSAQAMASADSALGKQLYQQHCATCHSKDGRTRLAWQSSFKRLPPDLTIGPFYYLPPLGALAQRVFAPPKSSNSASPERICPGMNTCPINKLLLSPIGCRNSKHSPIKTEQHPIQIGENS